ncbi:MAG: hypothetical protein FH758_09195 [Firmicutes bacterium]|nr:hypothetical protein [Bacillota bacterium]
MEDQEKMPNKKKILEGQPARGYAFVREPTGSATAVNVDGTEDPNDLNDPGKFSHENTDMTSEKMNNDE